MAAIVAAIPVTEEITGKPATIVGGLAVLCRLAGPYRATTDLDTVARRQGEQVGQLELLLAAGAQRSGPAGVLLETARGQVQVDVRVATPASLVAIKLQAVMNRNSAKEGTDLLDITRLTLNRNLTEQLLEDLAGGARQLRSDAALHAQRWFVDGAPRSLR